MRLCSAMYRVPSAFRAAPQSLGSLESHTRPRTPGRLAKRSLG
jgi:hypothetical protein